MSLVVKFLQARYQKLIKQANDAKNTIAQQRANTLAAGGMPAQQAWDYANGMQAAQNDAADAFSKRAELMKQKAAARGIKLGD